MYLKQKNKLRPVDTLTGNRQAGGKDTWLSLPVIGYLLEHLPGNK